jgi:hypothetical protein
MERRKRIRSLLLTLLPVLCVAYAALALPKAVALLSGGQVQGREYVLDGGFPYPTSACARHPGIYSFLRWASYQLPAGDTFSWIGCGTSKGTIRLWLATAAYPAILKDEWRVPPPGREIKSDWVLIWGLNRKQVEEIHREIGGTVTFHVGGALLRRHAH